MLNEFTQVTHLGFVVVLLNVDAELDLFELRLNLVLLLLFFPLLFYLPFLVVFSLINC